MANVLNVRPLKIDTTFSTKFSVQTGAPTGVTLNLDEIYWYNPSASGDTFTVTLGDGNTVIRQGRCESANQSQVFPMYGLTITDFTVPTLSSGTLYIYYH
jgi:hypothetical protein